MSDYTKLYKPAQKVILFNETDPNLDTIPVTLPDCPPLETIEGYGLHPKDQIWQPPVIPHRLIDLERKFQTIPEIREYLENHQIEYQEEIEFIEKQWYYFKNGFWIFIFGVPTWIPGWHWHYLSYWNIDVGLPKYRSRDRLFYIFADYCYKDTKLPNGVDLLRRVCNGFTYVKYRQEGATFKGCHLNYCVTISYKNSHGAIQSMDGTSAKKTFKKGIIKPINKLRFWFKPLTDSSTDPNEKIVFDVPASRRGSLSTVESGLESFIDWATTASAGFYDGDTLFYYHGDEAGKTEQADIYERHQIVRKACSLGNNMIIRALMVYTSTVGEMSEKGGAKFFEMCQKSHWGQRNKVGQTESGLYNLFIPSYIGLPGYIDKFGNDVIEDPTEDDLWRLTNVDRDSEGKLRGAKRFLRESKESVLLEDDSNSSARYEEELRQFPEEFADAFIAKGEGSGLNLKKILLRIKEIKFDTTLTKRVNYEWEKDHRGTPIFGGRVIQVPDPNGDWTISFDLPKQLSNQKVATKWYKESTNTMESCFAPARKDLFTMSADPFKFNDVDGKRKSNAAASIFWERDETIDPDDKPIHLWESFRTVATYVGRPITKNIFAEQCLMAAIYWGAELYPEIDVPIIWDYTIEAGYYGYLKFGYDINGRRKKTPGYSARGSQQHMMMETHDYIELHCERIRHIEVLEEYRKIKSIKDLTNRDLFVAVAGSLMGSKYKATVIKKATRADVSSYFPSKHY